MPARRRFGSVRRLPSGRWQARYWDAAGNRAGAPVTFPTKGDAQRWLSAAETDMSRGEWHDPRLGDVPFGVGGALAGHQGTEAPSVPRRPLPVPPAPPHRPPLGALAIGRITAVEVQPWLARLHGTDLSPNTVAKAYRVLSGVLDGAVDARLIARSPCTLKGAGTERHDEIQIATPEQVAALAAAVGPRWEALVFTAAYGGLRWGELAGLRRRDVDLAANTIAVTRKLAEVNGQLSFGPPKSAAGRRTIGIPSFVARSLAVHIDLYALPGIDGLVFPSADSQPMRRSNFRRRVWEPATAEVGMSGFRFHDLRHTAATLAASSGTSLKALMARIGHASAAAALRYQHVIDGQDADIVRYLERFGEEPPVPTRAHHDTSTPDPGGHAVGTPAGRAPSLDEPQAPDLGFCGGDAGTRTHDPLLAKQVL